MSEFGYGRMDPSSSSSEFSKVSFLVSQMLGRLSTMKPVKVVAVTIATQGTVGPTGFVDVLPLVTQLDGSGNATPRGKVHNIPFFRLCGGKNAIICDPVVDDIGFVICADRDISAVKVNRKESNPGSNRQFDMADGVYVGGILCEAPEQYITFKEDGLDIIDKNGNKIEIGDAGMTLTDKTGNKIEMKDDGIHITGTLWASQLNLSGDLKGAAGATYAGNLETTGLITAGVGTADKVGLRTHRHTSAAAGNPTSAPIPE